LFKLRASRDRLAFEVVTVGERVVSLLRGQLEASKEVSELGAKETDADASDRCGDAGPKTEAGTKQY
jgi:hypothetical protein